MLWGQPRILFRGFRVLFHMGEVEGDVQLNILFCLMHRVRVQHILFWCAWDCVT